jgi:hypothetical protein
LSDDDGDERLLSRVFVGWDSLLWEAGVLEDVVEDEDCPLLAKAARFESIGFCDGW